MNENIKKVWELADASVKRFAPEKMRWQWGQALYLYALSLIDKEHGTDKYTDYLKAYYDYKIENGYRMNTSDTAAPALAALYLYEKTGEEKYNDVLKRAYLYFKDSPKILEGMPNHQGTGIESYIYPKSIWIDSMMMYGVFVTSYARFLQDDELLSFAEKQPRLFAKYLLCKEEGLFYHSYWTRRKTHFPVKKIFWGRGNGWVTASVPLFVDMFKDEAEKKYVIDMHKKLSEKLLKYQKENGYFETVFNRPGETYEESSATMLIAAGWFYGYRKGYLDKTYYDAAVKAFDAVVNDFVIAEDNLISMPKISGPTSPWPLVTFLVYKITPTKHNYSYGLASAIFAALEYDKAQQEENKRNGGERLI